MVENPHSNLEQMVRERRGWGGEFGGNPSIQRLIMIQAENASTSRYDNYEGEIISCFLHSHQPSCFVAERHKAHLPRAAFPPLFMSPGAQTATSHASVSEHRKQTPSVNALQSGDVFVQGRGTRAEGGGGGGEGFVKYATLSAVLHHLRQAALQLEMRITWVM